MARLRIKERVKRKKRALAYLQLRSCSAMYSQMWFWANLGFLYTLGRLAADDTPTQQPTRDVFTFLSAQDCINLLRFSQEQITLMVQLLCVPSMIRTDSATKFPDVRLYAYSCTAWHSPVGTWT